MRNKKRLNIWFSKLNLIRLAAITIVTICLAISGLRDLNADDSSKQKRSNLPGPTSEDRAYEDLYQAMDKFHGTFDVYTDQDAAGNHFFPSGWMGDIGDIIFNGRWPNNPRSGASSARIAYSARGLQGWAGIYWQNPENNWGRISNGGYDLRGATRITFWARGERGGEKVEFFTGGIGRDLCTGRQIEPFPDSFPRTPPSPICGGPPPITLTNRWQQYTIDLRGRDLSFVIGGFGWAANRDNNRNGAIFYLDDIQYDKERPDELRFLLSYETIPSPLDVDRVLKNAAFTYDNALALIAFMARGTDEDWRRATILADAFVYAQDNDRFYTDGRLRNGYMAGDLIDRSFRFGRTRIPGWWDDQVGRWYELEGAVGSHTGNLAWTMISLLIYYENTGETRYLTAAGRLGEWIQRETYSTSGPGGYTGGYEGWEPNPTRLTWKSTEHNIDVYVAFTKLGDLTGEQIWYDRALHAWGFVEAMWNEEDRHFWTGTLNDGITINRRVIPVDVQAWSLIASLDVDTYRAVLQWAERNCRLTHHGFTGFDFNTDRDGVWFEGTGQMCVAYQVAGENESAEMCLSEIRRAQILAQNNNGRGIVAACHDGVTTGFDWSYFARLHIAATSWYLFGERRYNPYWGTDIE